MFEEFVEDEGLESLIYHPYFFLRRLFFILVLYNLYVNPLFQVIANVFHTFGTIAYIWIYRPYKETRQNYLIVYQEITIAASFALSGVYIYDIGQYVSDIVQYTIMGTIVLSIIVGYIYSTVNTIYNMVESCRESKRKSPRAQDNDSEILKSKKSFAFPSQGTSIEKKNFFDNNTRKKTGISSMNPGFQEKSMDEDEDYIPKRLHLNTPTRSYEKGSFLMFSNLKNPKVMSLPMNSIESEQIIY